MPINAAAARQLLGVDAGATEVELRHAYREVAKQVHPDKTGGDSSVEFVRAHEALDVLLEVAAVPPPPAPYSDSCTGMKESERLDKHFFGTRFGSDKFDPRGWSGVADTSALSCGEPVQCVWRCKSCPEDSSVCCRIKPKKHSCICGHKVEAHDQTRGFKCGVKACRCPRLQFHCQQLGWEVKCACKHHVKDHSASGGPPWKCTKRLPGKDQKLCSCQGFHASWVCTCGHSWDSHETTWSAGVSKAVFAREWVAQGLRPECVAEALEKRAKWDNEASVAASELGREEAARLIAAKAQRLGVSMCAEARMCEAALEALDGSKLPGPQSSHNNTSERGRAVPNASKKAIALSDSTSAATRPAETSRKPKPIVSSADTMSMRDTSRPVRGGPKEASQTRCPSGVATQSFAVKPRPAGGVNNNSQYRPPLRPSNGANCDTAPPAVSKRPTRPAVTVEVVVEHDDLLTSATVMSS